MVGWRTVPVRVIERGHLYTETTLIWVQIRLNFLTQHFSTLSSRSRGSQEKGGVLEDTLPAKVAGHCTYRVALEGCPVPMCWSSAISPASPSSENQLPNILSPWPPADLTNPSPKPPVLSWGDQGSLWKGPWGTDASDPFQQEASQEKPARVHRAREK